MSAIGSLSRVDRALEQALSAYYKAVLTNMGASDIRQARRKLEAAMDAYEKAAAKQAVQVRKVLNDPRHIRPPHGDTKGL